MCCCLIRYRVPALLAVGLEGFWGLTISAIALPILAVVRSSDGMPLDDARQAWQVCAFRIALAVFAERGTETVTGLGCCLKDVFSVQL